MKLYSYKIPLRPSGLREGVLLETPEGWGEIAPLPGFSKETLQEALSSLSSHPTNAAHFGLACTKFPFPKAFPKIRINALARTSEELKEVAQNNPHTIKIKVGHLSPLDALALIQEAQQLGKTLRIDANRRWSQEEALLFFQKADPTNIEYVEEPTFEIQHLSKLTQLPIALDETLLETIDLSVDTFVLKPTILGSRLHRLIELGKQHKKKLVFSSSFESPIGLLHIAELQRKHAPEIAAGLDTYRAFTQTLLPMSCHNGILCSDPLPSINRSLLQAI